MPDLKMPADSPISEVIHKALADPKYAEKLKHDAQAAFKAGDLQSPHMLTLQRHFYADPEGIARLHVKDRNNPELNKTWLTLTTLTSPECLSTTTTTTTIW